MLNIQKTSSFKSELDKQRTTFTSHGGSSRGRRSLCNICKNSFKAQTRYELFCEQCRTTSETYRFAEWLVA